MDDKPISTWLPFWQPRLDARVRLLCFPYSGRGARLYRSWERVLGAHIELCSVQLPGRETRIREPRVVRMSPLVDAMMNSIIEILDKPFVVFGYSAGALIAFEIASRISRCRPDMLAGLIVASRPGPDLKPERKVIHSLTEAAFIEYILNLGGTSAEVLADPELRNIVLPILRSDFELAETYEYLPSRPLDCPIFVYAGEDDQYLTNRDCQAWQSHSTREVKIRFFKGGHFFIEECGEELIDNIAADVMSMYKEWERLS